jgi:HEAT repeat protein
VAVAFTAVQFSLTAAIVTVLFLSRRFTEIRSRRAAGLMPRIREELARQATGEDAQAPLARLFRRYPKEMETALAEFLHVIRGTEHQRLGDLAVEIGMVSRWEKRYRDRSIAKRKSAVELLAQVRHPVSLRILALALSDEDQSIRIQAARAQVRTGGGPEVEKVFAFALTQPLVVRALLAEELRPHLGLLSARAIPDSFSCGRRDEILAALDMIGAWRRGLAVPSVSILLRHPDPEIRAKAWQVLPFVGIAVDPGEEVLEAILEENDSVSSAAAATAGRMKLSSAVPALTHRLRGQNESVVLAAARSLSQLGNTGLGILEREVVAGTDLSAAASLEALEKTRIGRSDW